MNDTTRADGSIRTRSEGAAELAKPLVVAVDGPAVGIGNEGQVFQERVRSPEAVVAFRAFLGKRSR
jgi:hypothetical protein